MFRIHVKSNNRINVKMIGFVYTFFFKIKINEISKKKRICLKKKKRRKMNKMKNLLSNQGNKNRSINKGR